MVLLSVMQDISFTLNGLVRAVAFSFSRAYIYRYSTRAFLIDRQTKFGGFWHKLTVVFFFFYSSREHTESKAIKKGSGCSIGFSDETLSKFLLTLIQGEDRGQGGSHFVWVVWLAVVATESLHS